MNPLSADPSQSLSLLVEVTPPQRFIGASWNCGRATGNPGVNSGPEVRLGQVGVPVRLAIFVGCQIESALLTG
jgi:hypothetical protein